MLRIAIGNNFFRNEVRSYASVKAAFWRELIQNAVDNGATKIEVTTSEILGDKNVVRVTFSDTARA